MTNRPTQISKTFGAAMRQTSGNVSIMFALAIVPLILAAGAAVDYVRASRAQTALQAAVDGAALAAAMSDSLGLGQEKTAAKHYFKENFHDSFASDLDPDVAVAKDVVTVSA